MKKIALIFGIVCIALQVLAIDIEREVQICNFITQYLCILEDFQGKGYMKVRKELEENLNTRKLTPETRRLVRRLSDACDLAETTLQNLEYTNEDSADNSSIMWGESLGASGVVSLIVGDPTPLIMGVGQSMIRQSQLNKEKRRAIDIQMRTFNQMLNRYHMEINERRNDLADEHGVADSKFIRRSVYKEFLIASSKDDDEGINALRKITLEYPQFREAWYFYGKKLQAQKKYQDAYDAFNKILDLKMLIIRRDGLQGKALTEMGYCKYGERKYKDALVLLEHAMPLAPGYDRLHYMTSYTHYMLADLPKSLKYIDSALSLNPDLAWCLHHRAELLLLMGYSENEVWQAIDATLQKGFGPEKFFQESANSKMREFMKKDASINRVIPKITAVLKYGVFNDDVILQNSCPYPLTNVKIRINIYGKYDNFQTNNGVVEVNRTIERIYAGSTFRLVDVFSIRNNAEVDIVIEFSCDQSLASWQWSSVNNTFIRK